MITLYQDTKMGVAGISYIVPKSFHIYVDEYDEIKDNGLSFKMQEKDCCIEVFTVESDMSFNVRDDFISAICDNDTYTVRNKVDERVENGIYSIRAEFESKRYEYFEMHIGQRKGYDERVEILITVEKGKADIGEIMKREEMKKFINSFKVAE